MNKSKVDQVAADELLYDVADGVGVVTFNRPQARNSLTYEMYDGLADICRAVSRDGSLKALIITGAGSKAFAAGTDIGHFRNFDAAGEDGLAYEERMEKVFCALESCSIPTIAAISGACTGGGAVIAALCDVRIATGNLKFGFPIARTLGNCLSARNLSRVAALIGAGRTKDLIFLARLMGPEEALSVGVISEVVDSSTTVLARAHEIADQLGAQASLTMQATKQILRRIQSGNMDDRDLIALCYGSDDFSEGVAAFLEKRKPQWSGR